MTDTRSPESEACSSSNESETIDEGRAFRESAKKHKKAGKKLRAKFIENEKVWVDVPGQQGKVAMSVIDSSQDPSTGKWSYELKDSQGNTYYKDGNKWIREKDLEAGKNT